MAFSKCDFENGACLVEAGKPAKAAFIIRTGRAIHNEWIRGIHTKAIWVQNRDIYAVSSNRCIIDYTVVRLIPFIIL